MRNVEVNSGRWFSLENLVGEVWKDIPDYEGLYQVSNYGRVKSLSRTVIYKRKRNYRIDYCKEHILSCIKEKYLSVGLKKTCDRQRKFLLHRLVANAFIPNPDGLPFINHKDCNKHNNYVGNLEWCTPKDNSVHASLNDLLPFGEGHGRAKLSENDVIDILHGLSLGVTCKELADNYGVHISTISLINTGKNWKRTVKKVR